MRILVRTFNSTINSKTGDPLPPGQVRGTPEWRVFEELLLSALREAGHEVVEQLENPKTPDQPGYDRYGYVHKSKRENPSGSFFYMQMHLRELFTLDVQGWGADHSQSVRPPAALDSIDREAALAFTQELSSSMLSSGQSKHKQPPVAGLGGMWQRVVDKFNPLPSDYLFVPLQVPRDYVAIHHAKIDMLGFIDLVADWAEKNRFPVVFKPHPYNKGDLAILKKLDNRVRGSKFCFQREGNVQSLIHGSRAVWTVNSGVGFETLIHGKPVITTGNCDYKWVTYRVEERGVDGILDYALRPSASVIDESARFVYHYITRHGYYLRDEHRSDVVARLMQFIGASLF